ncbi:hypothetical protein KDK95_05405 [Actinospica sp. MGRD01-02]|uniref:Spore-associated protein A n=1 Tax=Actinospica acidithermotolerans TaxID=2828514 RepID=A0A941IEY2_9ACTN|nr:hypothetical protein [Actinospica acidithermotolerans]MBR7825735.1 hypothetical protein [Actinospica acidithermotolerans]
MNASRRRVTRAVLSAVLVAGTAGGLGVVGAGGASASSPCSGTLVWGPTPFYGEGAYSNTVVAYVDTYWDGSSNCEVAYKNVFVGQPTRMDLTIWTNYGSTDDPGYWSYYAGPVSEPGAGSCVWEEVDMWDPSGHEIAQEYDNSPHSCG